MNRSYSELKKLPSFEERFRYLSLHGVVGESTFGFDRFINQQFYRSTEWRRIRYQVIARDNGCDMGVEGYNIPERILIHHLNPMVVSDLIEGDSRVLDPEFLICVSHRTHNAIHYGDERLLTKRFVERRHGDTSLWSTRT